ncbi:flagellar hook-associated protein FlgK [Senegalia massiliensis]|uniref:flagellar hook-associated protein FlgK n=1 Tax=Senegalia massiliensis TaxID=1720316 RepID=UPI0010326446|nr:flagellar hook-associated protein FlgK [Senegalia massiliensis]
MFQGLSSAISGLYTNKKALDTVSHNIANSNNPYYVRQDVIQASNGYTNVVGVNGQIGSGVKIADIRQIRDRFLDQRFRNEADNKGYFDARYSIFSQVEEIMNEPSDVGLSEVMDGLWNSFDELSKDPDNLTVRGMVRERAIAFVETVSHMSNQLSLLQVNLNKEISNKVEEINMISKDIAKLNGLITQSESTGVKANDLRDKRNALIDRLSLNININAVNKQNGSVDIYIGGRSLVSEENAREIEAKTVDNSFFEITWKNSNNSKVEISGGYLKGILESRGEFDSKDETYSSIIPSVKNRLDKFVNTVATKINEIHKKGVTLLGEPGQDFFVSKRNGSEIDASTIKLNDNLDTLNNIVASSSGDRGDGSIAKEIMDLRDLAIFENQTADNYYRSIISDMGVEANRSMIMLETHNTIIQNIQNSRYAVSGVSMDEEMANMLKFQHSYTANSRVVNAIDEMIENVVNKMGRVGN